MLKSRMSWKGNTSIPVSGGYAGGLNYYYRSKQKKILKYKVNIDLWTTRLQDVFISIVWKYLNVNISLTLEGNEWAIITVFAV